MNNEPITCPYCGATQTTRSGLAPGQRLTCARCGDSFPLTHIPASVEAEPSPLPAPLPRVPAGKPVRANRLVAALVLTTMLVMAGSGLTYALLTVQTRRDHDRALPRKSRRPWLEVAPPAEPDAAIPAQLQGLGYLPSSTGLVAGLLVQELLASPAARDIQARGLRFGEFTLSLATLEEWTGIAAENLDHAVLGVDLGEGDVAQITPAVYLVVQTRRPLDSARVRTALKATKPVQERTPDGGKRTLYSATLRQVPARLWFAGERTLVLGIATNLEQVPGKPLEGIEHLSAPLHEVLEKRISPGTPFWLAGHSLDWKKTWLPTLLAGRKDLPVLSQLEQVRTFGVSLVPTNPPKLLGAFRCIDEKAARSIEDRELAPRAKDNPLALKYTREGDWLDVQFTFPGAQ